MNKYIFFIILSINCFVVNSQSRYTIKSDDGKVSADHYIAFDEGLDSVIVKNKQCKIKLSHLEPKFDIKFNESGRTISNYISISHIKKIKDKIYLLIGIGGNLNWETQLNLIFIKKNKILKYYVGMSNDKTLRDVTFKYLPKTKEVIIPIPKEYIPKDYIYEINLKENKLDSIKSMNSNIEDKRNYIYKLKIK